jgi:Fe2+ transport system protein FeoA
VSSAPAIETSLPLAIPLVELSPRRWATITDVAAASDEQSRLMGLGICSGRRLQLLKGGDPMILQVYGTRIGLSARLAQLVRVVMHADAAK